MSGDTCNVDNAAFAARYHGRAKFLTRQENTSDQIEIEVGLPVSQTNVFKGAICGDDDFGVIPPCRVHQNRYDTKRFLDGAVYPAQTFLLDGICTKKSCLPAVHLNRLYPGLATFSIAPKDGDLRARCCQSLCQSSAQYTGCADDRSHLSR